MLRLEPCRGFRSAFTLIELLIVICIIAILASILFPVFALARENARRSSCQSNLKQLGLGFAQYSQDFDDRYPKGWTNNTGTRNPNRGRGWGGPLYTYVKTLNVFRCPSDTKILNSNPQISYAYNGAITYPINGYNGSCLLSIFTATSRTVLLTEITNQTWQPEYDSPDPVWETRSWGGGYSPGVNGFSGENVNVDDGGGVFNGYSKYATGYMANSGASDSTPGNYGGATGRHSDGSNFLFVDGHVKWLRPETVSAGLAAPNASQAPSGSVSPFNAAGTSVGTYAATFSPI